MNQYHHYLDIILKQSINGDCVDLNGLIKRIANTRILHAKGKSVYCVRHVEPRLVKQPVVVHVRSASLSHRAKISSETKNKHQK
jgi:hypothetical protein